MMGIMSITWVRLNRATYSRADSRCYSNEAHLLQRICPSLFNGTVAVSINMRRLGKLLAETNIDCYAWALISNHFHLLLCPQTIELSRFMRRLLTVTLLLLTVVTNAVDIYFRIVTNLLSAKKRPAYWN